jgi:flagellar motor switch protein FliM
MANDTRASKLIRGEQAEIAKPFFVIKQRREFDVAASTAKRLLPDIASGIQSEIRKIVNDSAIGIDVTLCTGGGLDTWLSESDTLVLESAIGVPVETSCYMAMDHGFVSQLADLCLAGQASEPNEFAERGEFSVTEVRVCSRVMVRQIGVIQRFLFGKQAVLPAMQTKTRIEEEKYQFITLKIRFFMQDTDVLSWYLWVPREFFSNECIRVEEESDVPAVNIDRWTEIPVQSVIEMARKRVSVNQLKSFLKGEILPLDLHESMQMRIDSQLFFRGKVAEEGNSLVYQITELVHSGKK